jgi:hypothetical protein
VPSHCICNSSIKKRVLLKDHFFSFSLQNHRTREGKPYTAIVDGANVAYFGQNFEQGKFNYYQIQFLVDALESKGEHPLVILPQKYARKYFQSTTSSRGKKQVMDEKELAIIRR